jgi:hypothetical protein
MGSICYFCNKKWEYGCDLDMCQSSFSYIIPTEKYLLQE